MQTLPFNDKIIERMCLMCNHKIRHKPKNMLIRFVSHHQYLIDPLFKMATIKLSKYYGMIEIILTVLTKKNKQMMTLFDEKYRKPMADIILKDVIAAKPSPSMQVRQSFGLYFSKVKVDEFKDVFFR